MCSRWLSYFSVACITHMTLLRKRQNIIDYVRIGNEGWSKSQQKSKWKRDFYIYFAIWTALSFFLSAGTLAWFNYKHPEFPAYIAVFLWGGPVSQCGTCISTLLQQMKRRVVRAPPENEENLTHSVKLISH